VLFEPLSIPERRGELSGGENEKKTTRLKSERSKT